ncbi:MAG: putative Pol III-like exoribonuclease [Caudoviricetes sp.]|nr:MAG: putative Pol III-like exoribonuclease [Caudoviricetes sp.]
MAKRKYYMTLDTETATLPFANEIAKGNAKAKQNIAIAKPLVYDIGWVITDRQGNIIDTKNYLVQETFFVPNVFNTAYYCDKRPIYMKLLEKGEIVPKTWNEIVDILVSDLEKVDILCAYNSCFDFKRAIPFTERYIKHLYSADYNEWEKKQKTKCQDIANNGKFNGGNPDYLKPFLELRGKKYPTADLWGISCDRLININKYRNFCLENEYLTQSVQYFKSSAETAFQYLLNQHDFVEEHTALSDALIESQILTKALKKGAVKEYVKAFPFRELGTSFRYVDEGHIGKEKRKKYKKILKEALRDYIAVNEGEMKADLGNKYWKRMVNILESL